MRAVAKMKSVQPSSAYGGLRAIQDGNKRRNKGNYLFLSLQPFNIKASLETRNEILDRLTTIASIPFHVL